MPRATDVPMPEFTARERVEVKFQSDICPTCERCIGEHDARDIVLSDGSVFHGCKRCVSSEIVECSVCGGYDRRAFAHRTFDNRWVCNTCVETKTFTCGCCGHEIIIESGGMDAYIAADGKVFCDTECLRAAGYLFCGECLNWYKVEDMVEVNRGRRNALVCKSCYTEHYQQCPTCGQKKHKSDVYPVTLVGGEGEVIMCSECLSGYFYCELCDRWERREDKFILTDGRSICHECAEGLPKCTVCNGLVLGGRAEMRMSPLWGHLCNDCYNDKSQKSFVKYVKCWHWHKEEENHEIFFYQTEEDYDMNPTRYFGVELETLCPISNVTVRAGEMAEMINRLGEGHLYTETDGSLRRESLESFEIITEPFTKNYYKAEMENIIGRSVEVLRKYGWQSGMTNSCGLHFHVSRNTVPVDTLAKLLMLTERRRDFMYQLSGRLRKDDFDQYAGTNSINVIGGYRQAISPDDKVEALSDHIMHWGFRGRHTALNLTNSNTIELRIFKGTLDMDLFNGCFDALNALMEIAGRYTAYQIYNIKRNTLISNLRGYSDNLKKLCDVRGL